jgi:copper chaperone
MTELNVQNMTCGHCVGAVTRAVKSVDPDASVQVDLQSGRVRVDSDATAGELIQAIGAAGYPAAAAQEPAKAVATKSGCCGSCG